MAKISIHGAIRIRDRCGVKKKSAKKLIDYAFINGLEHGETVGSLNRYITHLYFYNKSANNIRILNEKVFIFTGKTLITVLNLPNKYKNTANLLLKNKLSPEKAKRKVII